MTHTFRKLVLHAGLIGTAASLPAYAQVADPTPAPAAPELVQPDQALAPLDWRFAPPDASLIGGIELRSLLQSPLLAEILSLGSAEDPSAAMMIGMAQAMLSQVERIQFAAIENGTNTPDGVLLVTGSLDDAMLGLLKSSAADQAQEVQATDSFELPEEPWDFRRIDQNTILLGAVSSLDAAAARMGAALGAVEGKGQELGQLLNGRQDLWISGVIPDAPAAAGVNQQIDGFALGLRFAQDLEVEAAAIIPDATQAQALLGMLDGLLAMNPEQFTGDVETSLDGNTARLHLSLSAEDVIKAIQQGQALAGDDLIAEEDSAGEPGEVRVLGAEGGQNREPAEPSQRAPRNDGKVVIYGLEGGPKEIDPNQ